MPAQAQVVAWARGSARHAAGPRASGRGEAWAFWLWAARIDMGFFAGPRALLLDRAEMAKQKYSHSFFYFLIFQKII